MDSIISVTIKLTSVEMPEKRVYKTWMTQCNAETFEETWLFLGVLLVELKHGM
jgi:hypothetical protein